jgi:hypothetical protein
MTGLDDSDRRWNEESTDDVATPVYDERWVKLLLFYFFAQVSHPREIWMYCLGPLLRLFDVC